MKNSLLAGLLKNTAANANQGFERVALFEIGRVFRRRERQVLEERRLAASVYGRQQKKDWRLPEQDFDFAWLQAQLAALGRRLRLELTFSAGAHPVFAPGCSFRVEAGGRACGWCGEIAAGFRAACKLERPVFALELDLEALLACRDESRFRAWNRFPATRRDFTFLMAKKRRYQELHAAIGRLRPALLESFELTDVFQGPAVPEDKVSFSMSFTYRAPERTLTGDEVNGVHADFTGRLAADLDLIQR